MIYTACPDFVPLIESGHYSPDDALIREAVARYLRPMKDAGVGAILLGCTHYGLISAAIEDYMGAETRLVSASECAARELSDKLRELDMTGGCGEERYLTSGETGDFGPHGRDIPRLAAEARRGTHSSYGGRTERNMENVETPKPLSSR